MRICHPGARGSQIYARNQPTRPFCMPLISGNQLNVPKLLILGEKHNLVSAIPSTVPSGSTFSILQRCCHNLHAKTRRFIASSGTTGVCSNIYPRQEKRDFHHFLQWFWEALDRIPAPGSTPSWRQKSCFCSSFHTLELDNGGSSGWKKMAYCCGTILNSCCYKKAYQLFE